MPATPRAREVKPSTLNTITATAREGEPLYLQLERADHPRLRRELGEGLALRGLQVDDEGPGWMRVAKARQLVQGDACQARSCGGRISFKRCQRCGTSAAVQP
jgi:hypothetical protein